MFIPFSQHESLARYISGNRAVLVYFSTEECSVCKVLKPKVGLMISEYFPEIRPVYSEISRSSELAAAYNVFSAPTLVVFFDGQEFIRKSRNFAIGELKEEIGRLYSLMFS